MPFLWWTVWTWRMALGCSDGATVAEPVMDAVILTAPAADGHPPWQLELVLPDGATDKHPPEKLIAPLIGALQGPLGACWAADDLKLTGSVVVDTDLVFDGHGGASLSASPTSSPLGKCVITAFNAKSPTGLPAETWRGAVGVRFVEAAPATPENSEGPPTPAGPP
jgi:hypothetical protein